MSGLSDRYKFPFYVKSYKEGGKNVRSFTSINEKGVAKQGSLRMARCVNKGLIFYSEILNDKEIESLDEIVCSIKWIGSMRNRGFGKVKFTVLEDES